MAALRPPDSFFFFIPLFALNGQENASGYIDTVSWDTHYEERTASGERGPGSLIVASASSDVGVARFSYTSGMIADVYYPENNDISELKSVVILVSGDTDTHAIRALGRALKDTGQYLQWGQVIAEAGYDSIVSTAFLISSKSSMKVDAAAFRITLPERF